MKWAGLAARMGVRRGAYKIWLRKSEEKIQLGRHRDTWENGSSKSEIGRHVLD
jgi:hypothetical protein